MPFFQLLVQSGLRISEAIGLSWGDLDFEASPATITVHRLRATAALIRSHFRPYDLIIRFGGDEFVCVFFDMEAPEAAQRFSLVSQGLKAAEKASVSISERTPVETRSISSAT